MFDETCVMVFTSRNIAEMSADGGSRAWVLDAKRARTCHYLVCAWNGAGEYARASEGRSHGEVFLVAPITSVEPDAQTPGRYIICFSKFSRVSIPRDWVGRNPVRYASFGELGIRPDALSFEDVSGAAAASPANTLRASATDVSPLSIEAAKIGLAAHFGVAPGSIEIVIRG